MIPPLFSESSYWFIELTETGEFILRNPRGRRLKPTRGKYRLNISVRPMALCVTVPEDRLRELLRRLTPGECQYVDEKHQRGLGSFAVQLGITRTVSPGYLGRLYARSRDSVE